MTLEILDNTYTEDMSGMEAYLRLQAQEQLAAIGFEHSTAKPEGVEVKIDKATGVITPKRKRTPDEIYELGRQARARKDDAQWELGDLAVELNINYGDDDLGEFAKQVGCGKKSVQDYRRYARFFENPARADFLALSRGQEDTPKVFYSHFRLAYKLGNVKRAYEFLNACLDLLWTVDQAEWQLMNDTYWGLKKTGDGDGEGGSEDKTETEPDTTTILDEIPAKLDAGYEMDGFGYLMLKITPADLLRLQATSFKGKPLDTFILTIAAPVPASQLDKPGQAVEFVASARLEGKAA